MPSGDKRPELTKNLKVADFRNFYWLKEELVSFCKSCGIPTAGSKLELNQRIEQYLTDGTIAVVIKPKRGKSKQTLAELSLDTLISENYSSNEQNRAFFKTVIGEQFHFTTNFMRFCRENAGKTYRDAVNEWYKEQKSKQDKSFKTEIAPQFEYNRYVRDYLADNQDKSFKDAVKAWNKKKKQPGSKQYSPADLKDDSHE